MEGTSGANAGSNMQALLLRPPKRREPWDCRLVSHSRGHSAHLLREIWTTSSPTDRRSLRTNSNLCPSRQHQAILGFRNAFETNISGAGPERCCRSDIKAAICVKAARINGAARDQVYGKLSAAIKRTAIAAKV